MIPGNSLTVDWPVFQQMVIDGDALMRDRKPDPALDKYQQAMRQVMVDLPVVPLWEVPWVYGVRDDIDWLPPAYGWFNARDVRRR